MTLLDAPRAQARPKPGDWPAPKSTPALDGDALADWRTVTAAVRAFAARHGLPKAEMARRADIPGSTFSEWVDGVYRGNVEEVSAKVRRCLDAAEATSGVAAALPPETGFVETPTARRIADVMIYAQAAPDMAVVTCAAGLGKTSTARWFAATRPHVHLITMRPSAKTVHGVVQELVAALRIEERSPSKLDRAIGEALARSSSRRPLLIVDEGQNLSDAAVNQLRYFHDEFGAALVLLGNDELSGRWQRGSSSSPQIFRRIGKRLRVDQAQPGDVDAILDAYAVADPRTRALAHVVAKKPGALGELVKALRMALFFASGEGAPLTPDHLRAAYAERHADDALGRVA
jgi:hypothetical protein